MNNSSRINHDGNALLIHSTCDEHESFVVRSRRHLGRCEPVSCRFAPNSDDLLIVGFVTGTKGPKGRAPHPNATEENGGWVIMRWSYGQKVLWTRTFPPPSFSADFCDLTCVTFNSDGTLFAISLAPHGTYVTDFSDGKQLFLYPDNFRDDHVERIAFSSSDTVMAIGTFRGKIFITHVSSGRRVQWLHVGQEHRNLEIISLHFCDQDRRLISTDSSGAINVWGRADPNGHGSFHGPGGFSLLSSAQPVVDAGLYVDYLNYEEHQGGGGLLWGVASRKFFDDSEECREGDCCFLLVDPEVGNIVSSWPIDDAGGGSNYCVSGGLLVSGVRSRIIVWNLDESRLFQNMVFKDEVVISSSINHGGDRIVVVTRDHILIELQKERSVCTRAISLCGPNPQDKRRNTTRNRIVGSCLSLDGALVLILDWADSCTLCAVANSGGRKVKGRLKDEKMS